MSAVEREDRVGTLRAAVRASNDRVAAGAAERKLARYPLLCECGCGGVLVLPAAAYRAARAAGQPLTIESEH